MRESYIRFRKFIVEAWYEWFRWMLLFMLISMVLATAVLWWRIGEYPFLVYLCCFLGSLAGSWVFMFLRKPSNKEFEGDY